MVGNEVIVRKRAENYGRQGTVILFTPGTIPGDRLRRGTELDRSLDTPCMYSPERLSDELLLSKQGHHHHFLVTSQESLYN